MKDIKKTIKTSIIVPTYNGSRKVERLLFNLKPQIDETRELIIVDDGSTDGSAEYITQELAGVPNSRLIEKPNGGRSYARNAGAAEAKGEIIIFIDDDILVPSGFLDRIEEVHKRSPSSWLTGSVVQDIPSFPRNDFFRFRSRLDYVPTNTQHSFDGVVDQPSFTTQQLSVNASIFHETGGFDEQLTDSEDFELGTRVTLKGYSILHDLRNVVHHADYSDFDKFIHRQKEYKHSKKVLARARPDLAERFPHVFHRNIKNGFVKSWIRKIFIYNRLWKVLFRSDLRMLIPEVIRFKMYDLVISSTVLYHSSSEEKI